MFTAAYFLTDGAGDDQVTGEFNPSLSQGANGEDDSGQATLHIGRAAPIDATVYPLPTQSPVFPGYVSWRDDIQSETKVAPTAPDSGPPLTDWLRVQSST